MSESPIERRQREALERCKAPAQRERVAQLHAEGIVCYPESRRGRTVVGEFRRYVQTFDASKIGEALYHFSTGGAGGLNEIAHFNLYGFRGVYSHPAIYVEQLLMPEVERARFGDHSQYVYTDGMTARDVREAIVEIATEHRVELIGDYAREELTDEFALACAIAERLGMRLVPATTEED